MSAAWSWTSAFGRGCGVILQYIVDGLALTRISPNVLTFIGLVINIVAAVFFGRANATNVKATAATKSTRLSRRRPGENEAVSLASR